MGTAVNWDYALNNPVRGVKMPERTLKRPHRFLTAEEVRRLIAASNEPLRTIIILATMTGLRVGEILVLRWGRIDLLRGTLRVAETCDKRETQCAYVRNDIIRVPDLLDISIGPFKR